MAKFHFVEDYEQHVARLMAEHPSDEAMALAVGGSLESFRRIGEAELAILKAVGLGAGMSIFDLGCGSGRLAMALGGSGIPVEYFGTDLVQALLDYARSKAPPHFQFRLHHALSIPLQDNSVDIACAFSVFTHLLHHETYIYLADMHRVLRPGGRVVFSFLEFAAPAHWPIFERTIEDQKKSTSPHLNAFIERSAIETWARHLGFGIDRFIDGHTDLGPGPLGQAAVVLSKR